MVYKLRAAHPHHPILGSTPFCLTIIDICLRQNDLLYLFIVNYKSREQAGERAHTQTHWALCTEIIRRKEKRWFSRFGRWRSRWWRHGGQPMSFKWQIHTISASDSQSFSFRFFYVSIFFLLLDMTLITWFHFVHPRRWLREWGRIKEVCDKSLFIHIFNQSSPVLATLYDNNNHRKYWNEGKAKQNKTKHCAYLNIMIQIIDNANNTASTRF